MTYMKMLKNVKVLVTSLVIIGTAGCVCFLDPTLEPHLRTFDLTPVMLGLIFLAGAGTYSLFSPIVGWMSAKVNKEALMAVGLLLVAFGYLMIGPTPFLQLPVSLTINTLSLAIICTAYAIAFVPTFENILQAVTARGAPDDTNTNGLVSGWWSFCNSLGEMLGASVSGLLVDNFGFLVASQIVAASATSFALIVIVFMLSGCISRRRATSSERSQLVDDDVVHC